MGRPWFQEYRPKRLTEMIFASNSPFELLSWLRTARNNKDGAVFHIFGPPGCGKSLMVEIAARMTKFKPIEMTSEEIYKVESIPSKDLFQLKPLILLDEPESSGISKLIAKIIKMKAIAVVISSAAKVDEVEFTTIGRPSNDIVFKALQALGGRAGLRIEGSILRRIAERSNGDIRAAINEMQFVGENKCSTLVLGKIGSRSLSAFCASLFNGYSYWTVIEEKFDPRAVSLVLSSVINSGKDWRGIVNIIERCSFADVLPREYAFLALISINQSKSTFSYLKEEQIQKTNKCKSNSFERLLAGKPKRRVNRVREEQTQTPAFVFRYVAGSSRAIYRDVSLSDILNM